MADNDLLVGPQTSSVQSLSVPGEATIEDQQYPLTCNKVLLFVEILLIIFKLPPLQCLTQNSYMYMYSVTSNYKANYLQHYTCICNYIYKVYKANLQWDACKSHLMNEDLWSETSRRTLLIENAIHMLRKVPVK